MTMEPTQLRNIIEGALLAAGQPMNLNRLKSLFEEDEQPEKEDILAALEAITTDCEGRGFELKEVGSGWRFQVRNEIAPWINRLWEEKPQKYSRALLETLALVAYRQPITRGDIEEIRGVAVSSHIIKTLTEREWVKAVGHRDVPGRPALYATTRQFLDYFNLKSLEELPSLGEIRDLNDLNKVLDWDHTPDSESNVEGDSAEENVAQDEAAPEEASQDDLVEDRSELDQIDEERTEEAGSEESDTDETAFVPTGFETPDLDTDNHDEHSLEDDSFEADTSESEVDPGQENTSEADDSDQEAHPDLTEEADAELTEEADPERPTIDSKPKSLFDDSDEESDTASANHHEPNTETDKSSL